MTVWGHRWSRRQWDTAVKEMRPQSTVRKPRSLSPTQHPPPSPSPPPTFNLAPEGYTVSYGCGPMSDTFRTTKPGYSPILMDGRPCFWSDKEDGTGHRCFPKALINRGIWCDDGVYYYMGEKDQSCVIDERFGPHLGLGRL